MITPLLGLSLPKPMETLMIPITKIKISNEVMICVNDLNAVYLNHITPLNIDENYNLLDNYKEYFQYLMSRSNLVPVIISSAIENFYLDSEIIRAA
jgi:hypothetical protein